MKHIIACVIAFTTISAQAVEVKYFKNYSEYFKVVETLPSLGWMWTGPGVYWRNGARLNTTCSVERNKLRNCFTIYSAEEVAQERAQTEQERVHSIALAKKMGL